MDTILAIHGGVCRLPGMLSFLHPHRAILALWLAVSAISMAAQANGPTPAGAVPLLQPLGLSYDTQGNLFFAEAGNHLVRRLDTSGNLTSVAGTGAQGFSGDGGPASAAQLDSPHAVAADSLGNLFIADTNNHRVRRVDAATHTITTVAGTGVVGFSGDSVLATTARLSAPLSLAIEGSSLYIADSRNHRVRRLDWQTGFLTTVAGNGSQGFSGDGGLATSASLDTPSGIALDTAGTLYIADTGNHRIRRVDPVTHLITTIAGPGSVPALARPAGLALRSGTLLIADPVLHRLLQLDLASGLLRTAAGQGTQSFFGDGASATASMLDSPAAVALSPSGAVTIADTGNQRIRQIAADGSIATVAGIGTLSSGTLLLSGATTQTYGATTLLAALSGTSAQGTVSLLEDLAGSTSLLAQSTSAAGVARFALPSLSAGIHHLFATVAADATHRAAQSQGLVLTVAPIPLTASLSSPLTTTFGQPLPTLAATLSGALPADSARPHLSVTTSATPASAPGTYPVSVALSGDAATNYTFTPPSATLTVARAPVAVSLIQVSGILVARVSSAVGTPTGTLTLLTGAGTRLSTILLDSTGAAQIAPSSLGDGFYSLTAVYSGDVDFLSAASPTANLTVGTPPTPPDFSLSLAGSAAQTVHAGETAAFSIALKTSGTSTLAGPITLSASGLPVGFVATFDPPLVPPGGAVSGVTLSIATPRALAGTRHGWITVACLAPLLLLCLPRHRRAFLGSLALIALCGCGTRVNSAASGQNTTATYPITVTGVTTNLDGSILQRTATVTLTVE